MSVISEGSALSWSSQCVSCGQSLSSHATLSWIGGPMLTDMDSHPQTNRRSHSLYNPVWGMGKGGGGGDRGVRTSHLQYLCLPTPATFWRCSRKNSETRDRDPVVLRLFPLRSPSPLFLAFLSFSEHLSTPPLLMTQRSHICHPPKKDVVLFILWLNVALENRVYSVIKTSATVLQYKNETEVLRFLFSV